MPETAEQDLQKYQERQPAVIPPDEMIDTTPANLLAIAVNQGADLEKLEKLMDLQDRWEKNEARKAYVVAMTAFKADPPEILKQTQVEYKKKDGTTTKYKHASLDHVAEQINKALSKHGLFVSWPLSPNDNKITVTCKITHTGGHSEETSLPGGADLSGNKNAIQGLGSTITYLQRYTILSLTGLAAKGMDNDGQTPEEEAEPINQDQIGDIEKLKKQCKIDEMEFVNRLQKKFKVAAVDRLDTDQAEELKKALGILVKK